MTDKITIERETVELAASLIQPLTGKGDREVYDALRAALAAQPAEPVAWRWKERVNGMSDSDWTVTNVEPPDGVRVIAKEPLYAAQPAPAADKPVQPPAVPPPIDNAFVAPGCEQFGTHSDANRLLEILSVALDECGRLAATPAAVPPGYALVPIEPTPEMCKIGGHVMSEWTDDSAPLRERTYAVAFADAYRAMIAAAGDNT